MQKTVKSRNNGLVLFNPKIGTLSGVTTPGQSGSRSNGNKEVLHVPQSSSITGTSPSDYLVSYLGHLLVEGLQRSSLCILQPQLLLELNPRPPDYFTQKH